MRTKIAYFFLILSGLLQAAENSASISELQVQDSAGVGLAAGPSLAIMNGEIGWGGGFSIDHPIAEGLPIYMGLDVGVHHWNDFKDSGNNQPLTIFKNPSSLTTIEVLPTFYYSFYVSGLLGVFPYLGFSVGPSVVLANGERVAGRPEGQSELYFQAYVRPGLAVFMTDSLAFHLEPKFGWLRRYFVFVPQFNLSVTL